MHELCNRYIVGEIVSTVQIDKQSAPPLTIDSCVRVHFRVRIHTAKFGEHYDRSLQATRGAADK